MMAEYEDAAYTIGALRAEITTLKAQVEEAVVLGQKRVEAMQAHERHEAIIAFDRVLSTAALSITAARAMRADYVRRIGGDVPRGEYQDRRTEVERKPAEIDYDHCALCHDRISGPWTSPAGPRYHTACFTRRLK